MSMPLWKFVFFEADILKDCNWKGWPFTSISDQDTKIVWNKRKQDSSIGSLVKFSLQYQCQWINEANNYDWDVEL